jgi:hypothetical protein
MADRRNRAQPDIPDLVVPPPRPASRPEPTASRPQLSAADDDPFDMEIERAGSVMTAPHAVSGRAGGGGVPRGSSPSASGLEVAYRRSDLEAANEAPPRSDLGPKVTACALTVVGLAGVFAVLVKVAHRQGGRSIIALTPHAFDASSVTQSAIFALSTFALAITLGYAGLKVHPRSYAMLVAATMTLIGSLAMVTVTLVATDEHPAPPDGALLIPYVVPFALLALGLAAAGRAIAIFLRGGAGRVATPFVAAAGGALLFAGIELSRLATLLP